MGPNQIASDIDEMNVKLYAAFGSTDTRAIDWGSFPPGAEVDCYYFDSEDELEASMDWEEHVYGDRA